MYGMESSNEAKTLDDYATLLTLAENFSDDGVINFNFLRAFLFDVVRKLKHHQHLIEKVVPYSKTSFHEENSEKIKIEDSQDSSNIKAKCIESAHDSLSQIMTHFVSSKMQHSTEHIDSSNQHCVHERQLKLSKVKSTVPTEMQIQFQHQDIQEKPIINQNEANYCRNEKLITSVGSKITELEANVQRLMNATSKMACKIEKIEETVLQDSLKIQELVNWQDENVINKLKYDQLQIKLEELASITMKVMKTESIERERGLLNIS